MALRVDPVAELAGRGDVRVERGLAHDQTLSPGRIQVHLMALAGSAAEWETSRVQLTSLPSTPTDRRRRDAAETC